MPSEPNALIAMPVATLVFEKTRAARLSPPAAIFWIVALSLAGWVAVVTLALALI